MGGHVTMTITCHIMQKDPTKVKNKSAENIFKNLLHEIDWLNRPTQISRALGLHEVLTEWPFTSRAISTCDMHADT